MPGFGHCLDWRGFMHRQHNASSTIAFFLTIFLLVFPANAHKPEISGDVAGTLHIAIYAALLHWGSR
jgi:hypothetical protein